MEKPLLLWVKSGFSFKWGTDLPETLVQKACLGGFRGVMLADTAGLYGMHRFAEAASAAGLAGIAGAELETPAGAAVIGAMASGWGQLCRLVTSTHIEKRVSPAEALGDSSDLFAITGDPDRGIALRKAGWCGQIFVPVFPGESDLCCPGGVLPIACAPSMFAGSSSEKDAEKAIEFMLEDERGRIYINCMMGCLFARGTYGPEKLKEALTAAGFGKIADNLEEAGKYIQKLRWQLKCKTGFDVDAVTIPKRFTEVVTWKGGIDTEYMDEVAKRYATAIKEMAQCKE